jgi:ribulose-5-phosphate 4-epimerase/fuculose-1-phosphate aldolase
MASRPDGTRLCELLAQFSEFKLYDNPPVMSAPEQIIPPSEKLADAHTVLCPFHGVTAFGRDLVHAFERLERLEFYARTVLLMT